MNHKTRRIIEQLACERRYGIADAKGAEYSGAGSTYKETGADTLRNFKAVAERTGVTPEQALMTYLLKHIDSITTAVREASKCVKDANGMYLVDPLTNPRAVYAKGEGIVSRLDDARNYLDLLECLLVELGSIGEPEGYWEDLEDQALMSQPYTGGFEAAPGYDMIDGPDITGCDGCDDPNCGFTECKESKEEPELERLRRLDSDVPGAVKRWAEENLPQQADTPDMIRGYDGILRPRSAPVDTPIIPPLCWGETGELSE